MKKTLLALACALGALAIAGPAGAGVSVGVNDDTGKYSDGAPQFWDVMKKNNLKQNAITVLWDETQPSTIIDQGFLDNSLRTAKSFGIKVVLDVYPMHSQAFTQNGGTAAQFGAFVTTLAKRYPDVTEYVLMNECNQTRFVNPQFNAAGVNQSAAICGEALAAGYDALKAISPGIWVWGIGVSPRGNDNAQATSNVSTSPVNFVKALGAWFKASKRTKPIMDGLDFHPYPIPQSLPFATGYADQENVAVSNLPRLYQAFYDAFSGTAQPTIGQQAGGGLPVSLNEVGIQTDSTGKPGYTGSEVSATAEGGVRGETATEKFQSDWYLQMLNYVACDPNIRVVNLFHLVDETALEGWQSGLFYAGYVPKASAAAVSGWIGQTGGNCTGATKSWSPAGSPSLVGPTTTGAGSTLVPFDRLGSRITRVFASGGTDAIDDSTIFGVISALETLGPVTQDTDVVIGLDYVGPASLASARNLSSASVKRVVTVRLFVKKGKRVHVKLNVKKLKLKAGFYRVRFELKPAKGAAVKFTTKSFYALGNGKIRK